jgi:hypothetical protein
MADTPKPTVGRIVNYHGSYEEVYPAIIYRVHDESVDLFVFNDGIETGIDAGPQYYSRQGTGWGEWSWPERV